MNQEMKRKTIPRLLKQRADKTPEDTAYLERDVHGNWQPVSWQQIYTQSIVLAKGFVNHGLLPGDQVAIIWEGNDPSEVKKVTYKELHAQVCKFANVLKAQGVKKGDRVSIYMQMVPELSVAMLACARIGAIHSIVFGAFSPDALADRCNDSDCKIIITQDTGLRGKKNNVPMKSCTPDCGNGANT